VYLIRATAALLIRKTPPATASNGINFDPNDFIVPGIGNIGSYPRNYLRNPGWNNHDISGFQNFPFGKEDRFNLQLRAEFFQRFLTPRSLRHQYGQRDHHAAGFSKHCV